MRSSKAAQGAAMMSTSDITVMLAGEADMQFSAE